MSGIHQILLGGSQAPAVDPYFYSVTSLLHGDGTNGGQNNTFLDSSSNNFTITRNGNTTQGSFSPFSQTGWGNFFDGTGDSLTFTASSAISFTGDMTLEGWVFLRSFAGSSFNECCFASLRSGLSTGTQFDFGRTGGSYGAGNIIWWHSGSVICQATAGTVPLNQWVHVAWVRSGTSSNNCKIYVNGVQVAQGTNTTTMGVSSGTCYIGNSAYDQPVDGYMSNLRLTNTAVYTANFTPSTTPLTAISGTSLLTCQANRFLDASSNNFTITRNGDVSVQPFSPFNPTTPYSTSAVGGSGYFDGSGDYLDTATSSSAFAIGTGQFTVEAWVYTTDTSWALVSSTTSGGLVFGYNIDNGSQGLGIWRAGVGPAVTSGVQIPYGAWTHIAVSRDGSNNVRLYANGVQIGSTTSNTTDFGTGNQVFRVGADGIAPASFIFTGYAASVRVIKGAAQYTGTTYTVPTSPLEAVANTSLLLNFTNGAIFDNAAVADYETVGNAQISTSVKKYGTGSMAFDGSGDGLLTPASAKTGALQFGTGAYTVEFWLYLNSTSGNQGLVTSAGGSGTGPIMAVRSGTLGSGIYGSADTVTASSAISAGQWYHVAFVRVSTATNQSFIYINGNLSGTGTISTNFSTDYGLAVGYTPGAGEHLNGYIDDLRISKGIARYTYNFTPPTAEFPNIGGTVTLTADPYFDYTTLLLPGNGTNGAQNNTFLDSSTNNFTITRNGNTTQGTFSPFSQTGWGNFFDGSGDYLTAPNNAAFDFGSGDFTIELWFYPTTVSGFQGFCGKRANSPSYGPLSPGINNGAVWLLFSTSGSSWAVNTTGGTLVANQWYHVAIVRSGTSLKAYLNGTEIISTTLSGALVSNSVAFSVGSMAADGGDPFSGYISNFRAVKGTAVYTANFTPPTTPLTAITNTSLLTCQSNRFIDNSTNAFAITRNGDVSVQAFSPFNPTAAWSAATNGGSGYFDGSGDYLTVPYNSALDFGSADFTVEGWVYSNSNSSLYLTVIGFGWQFGSFFAPILIQNNNGTLVLYASSSGSSWDVANGSTIGTIPLGSWNHFAVSRNGSSIRLFLNGVLNTTITSSATLMSNASRAISVGAGIDGNYAFNGYISNLRVVKGSAVYTAAFTPPAAPVTAISGTSLLTNFTNAGIFDATSKNDLETVGNAQISTTQSKFGGSSIYLDGTGDWLSVPSGPNLTFDAGDFTVEAWVYVTSSSPSEQIIFSKRATTAAYSPILIGIVKSGGVYKSYMIGSTTGSSWNINGSFSGGSATIPLNTWTHLAVVRYGTTFTTYVNGIQDFQVTGISGSLTSNTAAVAVGASAANGDVPLFGYLDDYRITKGIARYTSNFIPPTTAFLTL